MNYNVLEWESFSFLFYYIGELHSDLLHITEHTVQQSSLLIKLPWAIDPTRQNQLPGNPGAIDWLSSLSSLLQQQNLSPKTFGTNYGYSTY